MLNTFEARHRERKRKAEIEIIINKINPFIKNINRPRVLEFGSGDGYQVPYLKRFGNLITSDLYKSEQLIKNYPDVEFVQCDIRNTPFERESFDLIFSNHVLEHIEDIIAVFKELKRIGNKDCIYAFTIPTNTWLLFSIPAQCYNALQRMLHKEPECKILERKRTGIIEIRGWRKFLPVGHGWRKNFFDCFNSFRMKNWQALFCEHGFTVLEKTPLLLYAPSEFPIIPTTRFLVDRGICSSAIFILKKKM